MVSKPICQHCVAEVQLFQRCRSLSAGTVLQRCSCLSSVATYLPALCCRGAAVKAVSKTICRDHVAGMQLFKWCQNLSAGNVLQRCSCLRVSKPICQHCVADVQLFKQCRSLSAGTVLQRCSCLSSVATYLPALCCRGAAVKAVPNLPPGTVLQLLKWCGNLSAGTVLQRCSCLRGKTNLLALCCRGTAV